MVSARPVPRGSQMLKRVVGVPLWFYATWWGYAIVTFHLGLPTEGGIVVGALVAAFVFLDPTGAFWGSKSRASSSARPAAVLEANASTR
jgi:hypothetical protein